MNDKEFQRRLQAGQEAVDLAKAQLERVGQAARDDSLQRKLDEIHAGYLESQRQGEERSRWMRDSIAEYQKRDLALLDAQIERARVDAPRKSKTPVRRNVKSNSQLCAEDVDRIYSELHVLKQSLEAGDEDYERLRKAHPSFLTFKAAAKAPHLQDQIQFLGARQGRLLKLAQQLAGVLNRRLLNTVRKDWHKNRPKPALRG